MFQADMKETRMKKVNIIGIRPEVVAEMLHFIYTGVTSKEVSQRQTPGSSWPPPTSTRWMT